MIINPKLTIIDASTTEFFEGCISVPNKRGITPRAKEVEVHCLNENGEEVVIHAKGWYARILQHEIHHLQGKLYLDKASAVLSEEDYQANWKNKTIAEIKAALLPDNK